MTTGVWRLTAIGALIAALLGPSMGCRRSRLPPRADGAAVVVAGDVVAGETDVVFAAEKEPNDNISAAQKLDLGAAQPGQAPGLAPGIDGHISPPQGKTRDVDVFRVLVPAPPGTVAGDAGTAPLRRRLDIEVRPEASLAVIVEALDDLGQPLLSAAGGQPGEAEAIPNLSVTPGTYFVRVRGAGNSAAGAYRLVTRLLPLEVGEELEPNGKAALATEAPASGEMIGYHGWRHDQDWYRVALAGLAEGSVLSIDLEAVPGVTASLLVQDAAERKLTEVRGRKEERVAVRNIRLPASEPHVFLAVRTESGRNVKVRYNLRLRTEVPRAGGELEPNDEPARAQAISDGVTMGYLGRGDVDMYRLTSPGPVELDIEVAPPERVDVKLEVVRESDGAVLAKADAGKRQEAERLPNLYSAGGPVLIRLSGNKGDGNPDEPYRLTVSSRPPDPAGEREPNGSAASRTPLAVGATGTGLLFPRGDVDLWQVTAAADAAGTVPVTVTGIAGLVLDVRVMSHADQELGRFKVAANAPSSNRIATGGAPCCVIVVRESTGKVGNPRDRYTLVVGP
ncbi:MAG TPA: hypothetical protein VFH73_00755 [Polyangia bacterium]|jgi:hypothetical protein|nr:hypothetical protein [Polyangia bacterium]